MGLSEFIAEPVVGELAAGALGAIFGACKTVRDMRLDVWYDNYKIKGESITKKYLRMEKLGVATDFSAWTIPAAFAFGAAYLTDNYAFGAEGPEILLDSVSAIAGYVGGRFAGVPITSKITDFFKKLSERN